MPTIGNEEFFKLSKDDQRKAVQTGNFVPPKFGTTERDEFNKRLFQDPASVPPPSPEPKKEPEPKKDGVAPKPPESPEPPAKPAEPPQDFGGHKSFDDFLKAHNEQQALLLKQQQINDKINATNGVQGRKLIELQKQLEEVTKKISEQKPTPKDEFVIPGRPDALDADKYPDGVLDPKYQADIGAYFQKLEEGTKTVLKTNSDLLQRFENVERELTETRSLVQQERVEKTHNRENEAWDGLSQSLTEFQAEVGITMSVPWTQINNNLLVLKDEKASPEARNAAQMFINTLPPSDIDNFKKLTPVVTTFADFSEGIPKPKFQNMKSNAFRGYLADAGITFNPPAKPPAKQQTPPAPGVDPMDGSASSMHEPKLSDLQTGQEKQNRLHELEMLRRADPAKFNADPTLKKEYMDLRASFGAPLRA
jgi:hypothetical protein